MVHCSSDLAVRGALDHLEACVSSLSVDEWRELTRADTDDGQRLLERATAETESTALDWRRLTRALTAAISDEPIATNVARWLLESATFPLAALRRIEAERELEALLASLSLMLTVLSRAPAESLPSRCCLCAPSAAAVVSDALFTLLLLAQSEHPPLASMAAALLLALDALCALGGGDTRWSATLEMVLQPGAERILNEAAKEAPPPLQLAATSDIAVAAAFLTPVITEALHALNAGVRIDPVLESRALRPFFAVCCAEFFTALFEAGMFDAVYSSDLRVLADILCQRIEDTEGSAETATEFDECSACLRCLSLLVTRWVDARSIDARKYPRMLHAIDQAERADSSHAKRQLYAAMVRDTLRQWQT